MQRRSRRRINYFLKLTQPSSIAAIDAGRHDRGHFNEFYGNGSTARKSAPHNEIACSAYRLHVADSTTLSEGLSPYGRGRAYPRSTVEGRPAPTRRRAAGMNPAAMAFG
jgi:hypothetical protein